MKLRNRMVSCAGVMLAGLVLLGGCGGDGEEAIEFVVPSDADPGALQRPQVTLTIDNGAGVSGTVVITLVPEHAPQTVANFLQYVADGFYANTIMHRYQAGFVFQGGGYSSPVGAADNPSHKPTRSPIPLELKVSNVRGTVGMARTSALNSATSEFFINLSDENVELDTYAGGYAAFGYITDMAPVTALTAANCVSSNITSGTSFGCLPVPNLVITSATKTR